jgi:hypothetical protein
MSSAAFLPRKLLIFGILVPLAALIGYLLSSPDFGSFMLIGMLVFTLFIPAFLKWHHTILILSWNLAITLFMFPGNPPAWMFATLISASLTLMNRTMDKQMRLINVPSITWPLLLLAFVVLVTMKLTSGFGLRSLGGSMYGGRKYYFILASILAYFALSTIPIPADKARRRIGASILGGITPVFSHIVYALGPSMWMLFGFFTVDYAVSQNYEEVNSATLGMRIGRLSGLGAAGLALFSYLLMRYGVKGILDTFRPWRLVLAITTIAISTMGGFRSILALCALMFAFQFFIEGLHRTRILPTLLIIGTILSACFYPFTDKLPLPVQRCLSILPVKVDPAIAFNSKMSTEWRLQMWSALLPEVPKHLLIGKGCVASATDYFLAIESYRRGITPDWEVTLLAGDYHNGPLSVIIPFGLGGALAFVWFLISSIRLLARNHRYGDPQLKTINAFLFAAFLAKLLCFFSLFGGFHSDLLSFVGLVGLSVSINRGLCPLPEPVFKKRLAQATDGLPIPAGA